jgi:TfoX/Sxy family transcriptional regulator of competence genes
MEIAKPTDADRDWFRSLVPADARVEIKPMFGNLGAFVNGNMFLGLFGADVGVRLADGDLEDLVALGGGPFGPAGRAMGGYVSLPTAWRGKPAKNTTWAAKALDHVGALPPKTAKAPKVRKGAGSGR